MSDDAANARRAEGVGHVDLPQAGADGAEAPVPPPTGLEALLERLTVADPAYDTAVGPSLPPSPSEEELKGDGKYVLAAQYKEVGNGLFKRSQHAWAVHI